MKVCIKCGKEYENSIQHCESCNISVFRHTVTNTTDETYSKPNEYEFIGFWKRVGASFLDALIMLPAAILYMLTYKYFLDRKMIFPLIIYFIIIYAYQVLFVHKFGGTPGKLILKYRIINRKGEFLSLRHSILRFSLYLPSSITVLISEFSVLNANSMYILGMLKSIFSLLMIIDVLIVAFNERKRAVHDYFANSFVVTKDSFEFMRNKSIL